MNVDFEEWRRETGSEIEELARLESKKHELAEQLLMMELHQQASFKQYQEILTKIGSFTPTVNDCRPVEYQIPEIFRPAKDYAAQIDQLLQRYQTCKIDFDQRCQRVMSLSQMEQRLQDLEA